MEIRETSRIPHYGSFESTRIHGAGTDILETTRHIERWRHDLDLLKSCGIEDLRYSVPWHRIERECGKFDFGWLDGPMRFMYDHGMDPILDPLHHISFPTGSTRGFQILNSPDSMSAL